MLTVPEVKSFLGRYFTGLSLVTTETEKGHHTFSYQTFDLKSLEHVKHTVTNNGQVLVWQIGDVGKIGVSPQNKIVRFIDSNQRTTEPTSEDRLSKTELTLELEAEYVKAQGNIAHRLPFMKMLWHYLNDTKFDRQMREPKLFTAPVCPFSMKKDGKTVGMYSGGGNWGPGMLWVNTKIWTGRIQFFVETFLHEMCHQAAWCISKSSDWSLQGHGPVWQNWMHKVGLKPDQYDMNDDAEYLQGPIRHIKDAEMAERFGPRVPDNFWSDKHRLEDSSYFGPCWMNYKGRALHGDLQFYGKQVIFTFKTQTGRQDAFTWKDKSKWVRVYMPSFYMEH